MDLLTLGYWLFSALVQAMAALFAVVGVFLVFKIQLSNERVNQLAESAKITYRIIQRIFQQPDDERYMEVATSNYEEMIIKLKELISNKEKALEDNKRTLEESRIKGGDVWQWEHNIKNIQKEISICNKRLAPLENIKSQMGNIKKMGQGVLIGISIAFMLSLLSLFLNPILPKWAIITLGLTLIILVGILVFYIIRITIESIDINKRNE